MNDDDESLKSMSTDSLTVRIIKQEDYNLIKYFWPVNSKITTSKTIKKISKPKSDPFLFERSENQSS